MAVSLPITNLATGDLIDEAWVDSITNALNNSVYGGLGQIIEGATTPAGNVNNEIRWSVLHQALMRWTGTQWVFAGGPPGYYTFSDMWNDSFAPMAATQQIFAGTITQVDDGVAHYGVQRVSSAASVNSGAVFRQSTTATGAISTGAGLRLRAVFRLPFVGANSVQRIGFHNAVTAAAPVNGAWLDVAAGTATFKTSWASSVTTSASVVLTALTWYTVHIFFPTTTSARCIVLSDTGAVVLDVTNTSNIPPGGAKVNVAALGINVTNVTGTPLLDLDWIGWGYAPI